VGGGSGGFIWSLDEVFQGFCGRGRDIYDFLANTSGVLGCVVVLTIFSFRVAWIAVTLAVIITAATVSKVNLAEAMPKIYTAFHFFAYGIFSLAWIEYLRHRRPALRLKSIWGMVIILTAPGGAAFSDESLFGIGRQNQLPLLIL